MQGWKGVEPRVFGCGNPCVWVIRTGGVCTLSSPPPPPHPHPRVSVSDGAMTQELLLRFRSSRPKLGLNSRAQLPRQQQQQHFFHLLLISASKRLHGDHFPSLPFSERISVVDMEYLWLQSS